MAKIDELARENELLRMQLAACGVAALANTEEAQQELLKMNPQYDSSSLQLVKDAVKREIELRKKLELYEGR